MQFLNRLLARKSNTIIIICIGFLILSLIVMWLSRIDSNQHGLRRTYSSDDGYQRVSNWMWMTIEGDEFTSEDGIAQVNHVAMYGSIWFGSAGEKTWRVAHTGNLTVKIDDKIIFDDADFNDLTTEEITFTIDNPSAEINISAIVDINTPRTIYPYRTEFGIYEQSFFGRWSLVPSYRLYQGSSNEILANDAAMKHFSFQFALMVAIISSMILIGITIQHYQWTLSQNTIIVIALVLLSLGLRFIVMGERFYNDLFFHFIVPAGDDNYVLMGQQLLSGDYNLAGTFWPSAPIVWFAGIIALAGPQLWKIVIANILLSGSATGAVTIGAWQASDDRRVGTISGLIFALYPPLIFYQVTPQSVVLDAALVSFALLFGIMAIKKESFGYAALFGVMISLGGMSRGIILLLGVAFFIALLIRKPIKGIQLTIVAAIFSLLTLLPQNFANYHATGNLSLIPYSNGQLTLYSGNNRDADGIWTGRGAAWEIERLTGAHWTNALIRDFKQDPIRMIELNLRKISMFWNSHEYVSNVNYEQQGIGTSRLIAALSINGYIGMAALSFFVWIGMVHLISERKRETWFVLGSIIVLIFGTILFVLAGRLRVPVLPFLVVAAAVGINALWGTIMQRKLPPRLMAGLVIAIVLSALFPFLDANLPRKSYVPLPDTAIQRDDTFNNEIRLVGFDPIRTNHSENGYFYMSLYWEIMQAPSYDYRVIVELADENGRIIGVDRELGSITYPPLTATELHIGGTIQEEYLLQLPDNLPDFAQVNVGIYTDETDDLILTPDGQLVETPLVTLFNIGFDTGTASILEFNPYDEYYLGTDNEFWVFSLEPEIIDSTLITESLWQANRQIYTDYVISIQVIDENGELVTQSDSPFFNNNRTTTALNPYNFYRLRRELTLPDDLSTGTYQIIMSAYEFPSLHRLIVIDTDSGENLHNNIIPVGEFSIER